MWAGVVGSVAMNGGLSISMSEKAKALGIPERDLFRALVLVRNLRARVISEDLDPKATRIALIYAERVDSHFAQQHLTPEEMTKLHEIALELVEEQVRRT